MKSKKGFTLIELVTALGILSGITLIAFIFMSQMLRIGNGTRDSIIRQQGLDMAFSRMVQDFSSMSFVMTQQRNLVPYKYIDKNGTVHHNTKQTVRLYGSTSFEGHNINYQTSVFPKVVTTEIKDDDGNVIDIKTTQVGTLDPTKLNCNYNSESEIPHDGISFSIGISDADYNAGVAGNNTIKTNYFLQYRDDDGDGKYILSNGEPEDNERDGLDDDGDGLDGEEPDIENAVVGYQVTYFCVPMDEKFYNIHGKKFKFYKLVRKLYKPHNGYTKYEVLADHIVLFSIVPFKTSKDQRIYLAPTSLDISWDTSKNDYDYGELDDFNISFEITIVVGTLEGQFTPFVRIVTPIAFKG